MVADNNTKEAQATADKVKSTDKGGEKGAADAYQAMNKEVQQHHDQVGQNGYTQKDFNDYQAALVKDLQNNGTLPDISLEWAKDNKDVLHSVSHKQGDGGGNDLPNTGISHDAIGTVASLMQNNFNGALIQAYAKQLEQGGTFDAATAATGGDPGHNAYLGPKSTQAFFDERERVSANRGLTVTDGNTSSKLSQLFQTGPNGEAPLIQQLDTAKNGGKPDGNISSGDLDAWLNAHDKHEPNYQVVRDIRDGKYDGLKKQNGTDKISDGFNVDELNSDFGISGISKDDIKNGKKNYGDLANAFNAANGTDKPATSDVPPVIQKNGDQVSSIQYANGRKEEFTYDANDKSKLTQIVETKDGTTTTYKDDGTGKWGPVVEGKVKTDANSPTEPGVTKDGTYYYKTKDGYVSVGANGKEGDASATKPGDTPTNPSTPGADGAIHKNDKGLIDQVTTDQSHVRKFGYGGTDGKDLTSITNPDGATYTKNADGKWVDKDKKDAYFKSASVDQTTGVVSFERKDNSGVTDRYAPDGSSSTLTKDKNGASIIKNQADRITEIDYPSTKDDQGKTVDHSIKFDYTTDGKIKSVTRDGQTVTTTDGNLFKDDKGHTVLSNLTVDGDGTIHLTKDGKALKGTTDGQFVQDDKPPETTNQNPEQKSVTMAQKFLSDQLTQKVGEGPYQAAERLLGKGAPGVMELAKLLKNDWQDTHGDPQHKNDKMDGLDVGYQWLTEKNLQTMLDKSPELKAKYDEAKAKALKEATPPIDPTGLV